MNLYSLPPLIAALLNLSLGFFVFIKSRKSFTNTLFSLACFCIFLWLFGYFIVYNTEDQIKALFWCKIVYSGVIFIPPLFYHFIDSLLKWSSQRALISLNYIISSIFIALLFFTSYIISGTHSYFWGYQTKVGPLHSLFLLFLVLFYVYLL